MGEAKRSGFPKSSGLAVLEAQGTPIGPLDTLIAAQAISLDVTLVTNNVRESSRVQGLRFENWVDG